MKAKHTIIYVTVLALLLGLCGCSLARPEAGEEAAVGDRLIGCYITTEYLDLFDFEAYFNDNASQIVSSGEIVIEDAEEYSGRIYARLVQESFTDSKGEEHYTWTYKFEGLEGVAYFAPYIEVDGKGYTTFETGQGLANVHNRLNSGDAGNAVELSATLYVPVDSENEFVGTEFCYYINPVYQSPDGSVYLVAGSGYAVNMCTPGIQMNTQISEKHSSTVDGVTTELESSVSIDCVAAYVPETVTLIQMGADAKVLKIESFLPDALPEQYEPDEGCLYIIMEISAQDVSGQTVTERKILAPGSEDYNISVLIPGENGFMIPSLTQVLWEEG